MTCICTRFVIFALLVLLSSCSFSESTTSSPASQSPKLSQAVTSRLVTPAPAKVEVAAELVEIRFDAISPDAGLTLSITVVGDKDGQTTFTNEACCGLHNVKRFVGDVRVHEAGRTIPVLRDASGWTVHHAPQTTLTVTYRLLPSGPLKIDTGTSGQARPIIHNGLFHLLGDAALLLPIGRKESDPVALDIDATRVADNQRFVSSFGPGALLRGVPVTRSQIRRALYLGGPITLTVHQTPAGKVGMVYSAMDSTLRGDDLRNDTLAIIAAERKFFNDYQPWYLISVHGAVRGDSEINIGGGMGLTNSFVAFAASDLDFANSEHREQFRWVLAHEYFHQWNGLTLRVASRSKSEADDMSVYWFSEGVTDFYTMRLLTRAGLQSPGLSLGVLNDRLARYARNSRRGLGSEAAGALFWSDPDGEQIPYLRGYLAAWQTDLTIKRGSGGNRDLDTIMHALVKRAKAEPDFRVNNSFLVAYLTDGLPVKDAEDLRKFIIDGGEAPLDPNDFNPCLVGKQESIAGHRALQFEFANATHRSCFKH